MNVLDQQTLVNAALFSRGLSVVGLDFLSSRRECVVRVREVDPVLDALANAPLRTEPLSDEMKRQRDASLAELRARGVDVDRPLSPNREWTVPIVLEVRGVTIAPRVIAMGIARALSRWDDARKDGTSLPLPLLADLPSAPVLALAEHLRTLAHAVDPRDPIARQSAVGLARAAEVVEDLNFHLVHDVEEHELLLRVENAEREVSRLRTLIDRDRTGLAKALADVRARAQASYWIVEGRGSYAWNDDRYRRETGKALEEITGIATKALRESGDRAHSAFHPTECKRCTECVGQEHHWQDGILTDDHRYQCKHCDATAPACDTCGAIVLPHCVDPDCESHTEAS